MNRQLLLDGFAVNRGHNQELLGVLHYERKGNAVSPVADFSQVDSSRSGNMVWRDKKNNNKMGSKRPHSPGA